MSNFVFLGDSLTFGYGVPKSKSWVSLFKNTTDFNVINKGINGDTTPSMLDRFFDDVLLNEPSHLFLMGGTNDLLSGRSVSSIVDNLKAIIEDCKLSNIEVIIGIPPYIIKDMANKLFMPSSLYTYCEESLITLRKLLIYLCNHYMIPYVDFYSLTLNNSYKNIYLDGIHFNEAGNKLLFDEFSSKFL